MSFQSCIYVFFCVVDVFIAQPPPVSPKRIEDIFSEPITIAEAYTSLNTELGYVLKTVELTLLKASLYNQAHTPSGVRLGSPLQKDIEAAISGEDLILALGKSPSCNWLDIRLLTTLARATRLPIALKLIRAYETLLFSKSLKEALPKMPKLEKKSYLTEVHMKLDIPEENITIGDMVKYQWEIEEVILDLGKGVLKLEHVKEGCLEVQFSIPVHFTFHTYKKALRNSHKIHLFQMMYVKLGNLPLIIDPWFTPLAASPAIQHQMFYNYSGE